MIGNSFEIARISSGSTSDMRVSSFHGGLAREESTVFQSVAAPNPRRRDPSQLYRLSRLTAFHTSIPGVERCSLDASCAPCD